MTSPPRPVVAVDIDGVLNAGPTPATVAHTIHVPAAGVPRSPFLRGHGEHDLDGTVHLDPSAGPWLTGLRQVADVVWASTWEALANDVLAPLLGIDPLPVAMAVATHPPRFGFAKSSDSIGWKASVLREQYNGRPLVWLDDGAWRYQFTSRDELPVGQVWFDWRAPVRPDHLDLFVLDDEDEEEDLEDGQRFISAPTLTIAPDPDVGLTGAHRAAVEAFLADPYGPAQHVR